MTLPQAAAQALRVMECIAEADEEYEFLYIKLTEDLHAAINALREAMK